MSRGADSFCRPTLGDAFLPGEQGAHEFTCTGDEPLRFLAISTHDTVDICRYPDSGKVAAREQRPAGYWGVHRVQDTVGYWDDEAAHQS